MNATELKKRREKHGVSQLKIASLSGVSRYRLQMFEYGYGVLTDAELEKVEKVFKPKERK